MPENPRIEELRRRVQADPASIAFAALAEELRRIGRHEDAVEACRAGLQRHPSYLSARVTLGRALIELGDLDGATHELETVLRSAPENLAAIRGLAQIHERLGHRSDAHEAQALADALHAAPPPKPAAAVEPIRVSSTPQVPFVSHVEAVVAAPAPTPPVVAPVPALAPAATLDFPAPAEPSAAKSPDRRDDTFGFAPEDTTKDDEAERSGETPPAVAAKPFDIFDITPARAAAPVVEGADVFASYAAATPAAAPVIVSDKHDAPDDPIDAAAEPPADTIDPLVAQLELWLAAIHTARVEVAAR